MTPTPKSQEALTREFLDREIANQKMATGLDEINTTLRHIHRHMLWVFWLVAIFALLYFTLLVYLLMS